ncbi:1,4-dihydroxy-2-naphthoate octaprenyltransferase [bacterium]|nr:1,4-dihydroxy-2-naphthoate octaprenyltransferase [bacterium]
MSDDAVSHTRSKASIWLQASRPFSFTGSALPVLLGAALAGWHGVPARWELLPLAFLGCVLLQAGANLVSDYYDYRRDVDRPGTLGSSGVILGGLLSPRAVLAGGLVCFGVGVAMGLVCVVVRGVPLLVIALCGLLGGTFYTAPPIGLKYRSLGDVVIFVLFGPLIVVGSYLTLTGGYTHGVLLASLPTGLLIDAVLHANNLRDIPHDGAVGVRTLAGILGHRGAQRMYYALVVGAYVGVAAMVAGRVLPAWTLLVFVSAPIAIRNLRVVHASQPGHPESIATADVQTAQLHLLFNVLYALSLFLAAVT